MSPSITHTIKRLYKPGTPSYQYYNRVVRAVTLRMILRLCLLLFKVERQIHPIRKTGPRRILIIVLGGMGDCLLFDPLFKRIKEQWDNPQIDVFTGSFEQMWAQMESVNNLILFKPSKFKAPWNYVRLFRTIYRQGYDIVAEGIAMVPKRGIYPLLTSFIMQASCAPIRIGRKHTGRLETLRPRRLDFIGHAEMLARKKHKQASDTNPYLTHIISVPPPHNRQFHESAYIFKPLGLPFFRRSNEPRLLADARADQRAHTLLREQWGAPGDFIIAMTVETTRQIKAWPLKYFSRVIEKAIRDNYKFVMLGLDRGRAGQIAGRFPTDKVINLAGTTDLAAMIAIIGQCNLFWSCDTGPAHISQACGIPTVVLFGPSNEKEFGPVDSDLHTLVLPPEPLRCRPCVLGPCVHGKSCIQLIQPDTVYRAIQRAASQSQSRLHHPRAVKPKEVQQPLCAI